MQSGYSANRLGVRLAFWPLRHALIFRGRSTRNEVVSFWLLSMAAQAGELIFDGPSSFLFDVLSLAWTLLWTWPWIPLLVRRLHDQGRSGWWALIPLSLGPVCALQWFTAPVGHAASMAFHFGPLQADKHIAATPWTISLMVVLVTLMVANVLLFLWQPTRGANRFGPDPRLGDETDRTDAIPVEA
ncbi:MAG TPA: DUF805 domain-containing protein [Sphingomicrobium sp.]|nr:DUF805 domain-containing protein [Sphingomicrobium sp.]